MHSQNKHSVYTMNLIESRDDLPEVFDTVILVAARDERSMAIGDLLIEKGIKIGCLVVLLYSDSDNPAERYTEWKDRIPAREKKELHCSLYDPSSCLEAIESIADIIRGHDISLDVSSLNRPYIFYLLKLFNVRYKVASVTVYYTEPQSYIFENGLLGAYHSMSGPLSILEIPGFSGKESREDTRILAVLLGFDGDLSREISEDVSPKRTWVINGFPSYVPKAKDISLVANEKIIRLTDAEVMYCTANNPFDVFNLLEQTYKELQPAFLNVAPLGTKPMALGACLFALHYPRTRVVYPVPERYVPRVSEGVWNRWRYVLPLSTNDDPSSGAPPKNVNA